MKTSILAGLTLLGLSLTGYAQEQDAGQPANAPQATAVSADQQANEIQYRTYDQGAQLLDSISNQVGSDLDAKLSTDVRTDVPMQRVTTRLLVSND